MKDIAGKSPYAISLYLAAQPLSKRSHQDFVGGNHGGRRKENRRSLNEKDIKSKTSGTAVVKLQLLIIM